MNTSDLNAMSIGDILHSDLDETTYVVRTRYGWDVCDNGEQVSCSTAREALRIVEENAGRF
jgi:hypothetical protein